MSTYSEIKELPEKYRKYRDLIIKLFKQYNISSTSSLIKIYKNNSKFKNEWKRIWVEVSAEEGGKLSLTTIGIIIGSALGSVGIATMGSAIGVPLALILGLGGFLSGTKIDSLKIFSENKKITISLPRELYEKIDLDSKVAEQSMSKLLELIIEEAYK
ncbi:ribbon-helix-helix protein, CopG family [Pseudomonas sp. N040]|uniref:ribbon-helix-helix protein, CopG family n=1 Tax=Pseudomonas sp. N040 TaxID=2785325 RepID=UPI0018A332EF|nr:ribbon-helix-helix protein, CopG family [Pseudomonas sp. N040]MBF7731644.1 ribbon-helix-helix protein, CopG family [Pseudomonas sp. N040]MBW7015288.1 ribbon-helix-helix protein, CopG family [Pseudomonas sp. N040]